MMVPLKWGFLSDIVVQSLPANAGDTSLIPVLARYLVVGNGKPLQYFAWDIPWTEEPAGLQSWHCKELDMTFRIPNNIKHNFSCLLILN